MGGVYEGDPYLWKQHFQASGIRVVKEPDLLRSNLSCTRGSGAFAEFCIAALATAPSVACSTFESYTLALAPLGLRFKNYLEWKVHSYLGLHDYLGCP